MAAAPAKFIRNAPNRDHGIEFYQNTPVFCAIAPRILVSLQPTPYTLLNITRLVPLYRPMPARVKYIMEFMTPRGLSSQAPEQTKATGCAEFLTDNPTPGEVI